MTLLAALGVLPLAYGSGSRVQMLPPLAVCIAGEFASPCYCHSSSRRRSNKR